DRALAGADLVITGEGRFDETSLTGKTCGTVIAAAEAAGGPVAGGAGEAGDGFAGAAGGGAPGGAPGLVRVGCAGWARGGHRWRAGQAAALAACGWGAARQRSRRKVPRLSRRITRHEQPSR